MFSCFWKNSICPVWIYLIKTTIKNSKKLIRFCGDITFSEHFMTQIFQNNIYLSYYAYLSLLINLMHTCWIKVLSIYLKNKYIYKSLLL